MTAAEHRMKRYLRRLDALGSRSDDETLGLFGIPMGMISQAAGSMSGGGSGGSANTQAAVKQALEEQHNKEMAEQAAKNAATAKTLMYSTVGVLSLGALYFVLRK